MGGLLCTRRPVGVATCYSEVRGSIPLGLATIRRGRAKTVVQYLNYRFFKGDKRPSHKCTHSQKRAKRSGRGVWERGRTAQGLENIAARTRARGARLQNIKVWLKKLMAVNKKANIEYASRYQTSRCSCERPPLRRTRVFSTRKRCSAPKGLI